MMYENGNQKTLEDILSTSTASNMLRLKTVLLAHTQTPTEYKIVKYLCDGYSRVDIQEVLKISRQAVDNRLRDFKSRFTAEQIEDIFSILKED